MRAARMVTAIVLLVLAACGEPTGRPTEPTGEPAGSDGGSVSQRDLQIYSAVVHQVIEVDNTFGGPSKAVPFDHVLISDRIGGDGASMEDDTLGPGGEEMSPEMQEALGAELADLPDVRFVAYDDAINEEEGGLKLENAALVSLGNVPDGGDRVEVPVGMLCGGLCGTWLTYVVVASDEGWRVTGTTGPVGIA